jgi:hypothetical protein
MYGSIDEPVNVRSHNAQYGPYHIDWSDEAAYWFSRYGALPYLTTWVLGFEEDGRFEEFFLTPIATYNAYWL